MVVSNEVAENGEQGINVRIPNSRFLDNVLVANSNAGIRLRTEGNVVRNNTARDQSTGIRLYAYDNSGFTTGPIPVDDNVVSNNTVTGNVDGIDVGSTSSNNTIRDNVATDNGDGITLDGVGPNRVLGNNASANDVDGIQFGDYDAPTDSKTVPIRNNTARSNGGDGIVLEDAEASGPAGPFVVRHNHVRGNDGVGIGISSADTVVVADNGRVSDNGDDGIRIDDSVNVTVRNHTVAGNRVGFIALSSAFTVASLNASGNDGDGIRIDDSDGIDLGATVTANDNGGDGITIENSHDASIRGLTTTDNDDAGIAIFDVSTTGEQNTIVRNATVLRNGVGIVVDGVERATVVNNTVLDGNASAGSGFLRGFPNSIVDVDGTGIALAHDENATVSGNSITANDGHGVVTIGRTDGTRIAGNNVTDNGADGIGFLRTSGQTTIANNVVSDNGEFDPSETLTWTDGVNGLYLEDATNVTIRNNTIEGNAEYGVGIRDDSYDNQIVGNTISSHATANETGHGVFVDGLGVDFGFPANNTIADNEITDNDYGVSQFHDSGTVVSGNDILRNTIGVRFGSDTDPINAVETTDCTEGGNEVLEFRSEFGGSTNGTIAGNRIEADGTALKIVTHPSYVFICAGNVTSESYDDPTVKGYLIANNSIRGTDTLNLTNSRLDVGGEAYNSAFNGSNAWNVSKTVTGNVLGGPYRAGNYWATPGGNGFSQTCTDADSDGICDSPRTVATNNVDELPLAADQPAFFDVAIDWTTSPGVSAATMDVTATITNSGGETATEEINLTIDGTMAGSVTSTLDPGRSTTETFTWDTGGVSPGVYTATVTSQADSASVPVTIQPNVSVRIDATNAPVTETQTLTVEATVRNNREEAITETIELLDFGGVAVDSREVNLGAGESAPITLSWATAVGEEGTGDVTVRSPNDAADETVTVRNGTITDCTVISRPGVYQLESDLAFSGDECLVVESSDVSINGGEHEIVGSGDGTGVLVDVADGADEDLAVRNLTVRDVSDAIEVPVPDREAVSGISVTGVTAESIGDDALYSEVGENGTVAGLSVHDSDFATDDDGVVLDADDADATVRGVSVTETTLNTGDIGVELYLDYDRTALDGFELANSTVEAGGEAVELDASDVKTTVRNIRVADSTLNASNTALAFDYAGDDATFESVRIADSRIRGSTGVELVGTAADVHTRGIDIRGNDIAVDDDYSEAVVFDVAGDGAIFENATVAENSLAGDAIQGGIGITLDPSGGIDDHAVVRSTAIRNNSIRSVGDGLDVTFFGDPGAHELNVIGNEITNVTNDGISLDATLDPGSEIRIRENRIESATGASADGLTIDPESFDSSGSGTLSVRRNVFRTGRDALVLQSGPVGTISIVYNVFDAHRFGVRNENAAEPGSVGRDLANATMNYWAAGDGPGSAGPYEDPLTGTLADGSGSAVSNGSFVSVSNVRFDPFLTTDTTESNGSLESAFFAVTILETNGPVPNGSDVVVTVELENTGQAAGSKEVTLSVLDEQAALTENSTDVSLAAGGITNLTLSVSTAAVDAGGYTATVTTDDATESTAVTVTEPVTPPPSGQPIDGCTNITAPGQYALTEDVSGSGTCIDVRADDVVLDGNGHVIQGVDANNGTGIRAGYRRGGSNVTLRNVTVRGWDAGIEFRGIDDGRVVGAESIDNGVGILVGTARVNVNPRDPRVMILASANMALRENSVERNNRTGILLDRATNVTIAGNRATDNNGSGIALLASEENAVSNNTLTGNDDAGLEVAGRQITFRERETANRRGEPVPDPDSNDTIVTNNSVTNNGQGIRLASAPNSTVRDNTVRGNDDAGIFVTGGPLLGASSNLTVAGNAVAANNGSGIVVFGPGSLPVFDNEVANNTARANNGSGILLVGADGNLIRDNRVTANNESGVTLFSSATDNELRNNTAARNGRDGFHVLASGETLTGNNATANGRNGFALGAGGITLSGATASANGRDGVVVRAPNATVEDSVVSGNDRNGIHLRASAHGEITNNVANGNDRHGILVNLSATDNELAGNVANANGESGVALSGVPAATPENNSLTDTVARNNGAWAVTVRGATGTVVEGLNVGASTEPDTTLSFKAENVAVGASEAPPANPDNESIGRYVDAEAVGAGAFLDVELRYADGDAGGLEEGSLAIQRYDGTEWTAVNSTPNPSENVVAANVTDVSTFGVFATGGNGTDDEDSRDPPTTAPGTSGPTTTPGTDEPTTTPGTAEPTTSSGQPGFGAVLAAIALLFALVTVRRRAR